MTQKPTAALDSRHKDDHLLQADIALVGLRKTLLLCHQLKVLAEVTPGETDGPAIQGRVFRKRTFGCRMAPPAPQTWGESPAEV